MMNDSIQILSHMEDNVSEFTLAEIMEMESSFRGMKETTPSQEFCENLASKFSVSLYRCGQSSVKWEQVPLCISKQSFNVNRWFRDRQRKEVAKFIASPLFIKDLVASTKVEADYPVQKLSQKFSVKVSMPSCEKHSVVNTKNFHMPKGQSAKEIPDLIFEARSSKDYAWYDVAAFLNYRVLYSGELAARVRFSGFGNSHDEWVNVKKGVRQRSIPLEGSECHKVEIGDLVLCYRETDDAAIYCDAHIVGIERNMHDGKDCSCIFAVRYDHDCAEGKLHLNRICCRPC
ncbi:hypothetical protein LIER_13379 [Lithospermum erythrorhizon]|uniref:SAWADEE domain-containing protein n=1 Tax=Lithospermum erythrorhizon TaxID=34254 RepID=A0AAV3PW25_LITER